MKVTARQLTHAIRESLLHHTEDDATDNSYAATQASEAIGGVIGAMNFLDDTLGGAGAPLPSDPRLDRYVERLRLASSRYREALDALQSLLDHVTS